MALEEKLQNVKNLERELDWVRQGAKDKRTKSTFTELR
jgi:hypothetical protein